jgi:3-phenylpropionate/trans-cinnamate dioxygenase ferredoxin reductase component
MATKTFAIVGASLAGAKAAEALRAQGFDGDIVLAGDETEPPYERPPLSKGYLRGKEAREKIFVQQPQWYDSQHVDLRLGTTVTSIDRDRRTIALSGGETIGYDKLLLTTGSSPRHLDVPGAALDGVHYLRRVGDSERIRQTFATASRIVFVGAGWICLEAAAAAREAGVEATVLGAHELPLLQVFGPLIAPVFADLHRERGVDLRTGAQVAEIVDVGGRAGGVRLADGTVIEADAVVVGIGAIPNTRLAVESGLQVGTGVVVDASLQSSDPNVYAAGDVAEAFHPLLGKHIRVDHWSNALHQPATAARSMRGEQAAYDRIPYFFTDQYDLGMEYSGYTEHGRFDDVVVRGDLEGRKFIAFWLADGRVLAGMNVNIWNVNREIQTMIRSGGKMNRAQLLDADVPLDRVVSV